MELGESPSDHERRTSSNNAAAGDSLELFGAASCLRSCACRAASGSPSDEAPCDVTGSEGSEYDRMDGMEILRGMGCCKGGLSSQSEGLENSLP